jgi:cell division transport system ATP-binding protein
MIQFKNISKQYTDSTYALEDVSLDIADGEFVFLIGPSGAGKTTLLRLLLRDTLPTAGSVTVDNIEVNSLSHRKVYLLRRKIGMVFQDFKLLLDRTVAENVAIALEILGKPKKVIEKDVGDILGLVGLTDKARHFPQQLSAGELQRTGIARAVVGGPNILLADEPTGNLDPHTSQEILDILLEINKVGTTIIMATHNAAIVNHMKKRTVALRQGKIVHDEQKGKYITPGRGHDE